MKKYKLRVDIEETITEETPEIRDSYTYPFLMESNDSEIIVLFFYTNSGVVLNSFTSSLKVGAYSKFWNLADFHPFNGKMRFQNTEDKYPCIKKFLPQPGFQNSALVLFTEEKHGTIIYAKDDELTGDFHTDWAMNMFTHYDGKVTLSNESFE